MIVPLRKGKTGVVLHRHAFDRVIIFTYDNASVYEIARRFLVPAITHQTKTRERQQILERFHSGAYNVVVTSQVLNENACGVKISLNSQVL